MPRVDAAPLPPPPSPLPAAPPQPPPITEGLTPLELVSTRRSRRHSPLSSVPPPPPLAVPLPRPARARRREEKPPSLASLLCPAAAAHCPHSHACSSSSTQGETAARFSPLSRRRRLPSTLPRQIQPQLELPPLPSPTAGAKRGNVGCGGRRRAPGREARSGRPCHRRGPRQRPLHHIVPSPTSTHPLPLSMLRRRCRGGGGGGGCCARVHLALLRRREESSPAPSRFVAAARPSSS